MVEVTSLTTPIMGVISYLGQMANVKVKYKVNLVIGNSFSSIIGGGE